LRSKVEPSDFDPGKTRLLHDCLYFGSSKDSIGIQIADLCAYIIRRRLEGDPIFAGFYDTIKECVSSFQVGPSDDVMEFKNQEDVKGQTA